MTFSELISAVRQMIPDVELPDTVWQQLNAQLDHEISANVYGNVPDSRRVALLADKVSQYAMKSFSSVANHSMKSFDVPVSNISFNEDGMPYVPPNKPVSYTVTYSSSNTSPLPILKVPLPVSMNIEVEGNLTWGEPIDILRKHAGEGKNQEPLFKTPDPPLGYRIEKRNKYNSIWYAVTRVPGMNPRTRRWFSRRLPTYYVYRSVAAKTMERLQELNPENIYRVREYYKPKP